MTPNAASFCGDEKSEPPLVREQEVLARRRRHHHLVREVGGAQRARALACEREVRIAQVYELYGPIAEGEAAVWARGELARVGDARLDARVREQRAKQLELRREKLLSRCVVDDRDPAQPVALTGSRARSAYCGVLGSERVHEVALEVVHREQLRANAGQLLGVAQRGGVEAIQQRAAGVRVDLDQARTGGRDVKVVAHEHAEVSGRVARSLVGAWRQRRLITR